MVPQSTYIYRAPQCMSPRRNWDSPNSSPASECAPPLPDQRVGGRTRLRLRGWGSPNSDDWRKSLALCLLCGWFSSSLLCSVVANIPPMSPRDTPPPPLPTTKEPHLFVLSFQIRGRGGREGGIKLSKPVGKNSNTILYVNFR